MVYDHSTATTLTIVFPPTNMGNKPGEFGPHDHIHPSGLANVLNPLVIGRLAVHFHPLDFILVLYHTFITSISSSVDVLITHDPSSNFKS